jgi:hypothetical protein
MSGVWTAMAQSGEPDAGLQRPVSAQEIDQLRRRIFDESRSSFEALFQYHSESGDLNNRLDFLRAGGRLNLRLSNGTIVYVNGTHTPYWTQNDAFDGWGTNGTVGVKAQLTEGTSGQLEVGATRFSTDRSVINGLAAATFSSERSRVTITGSRSSVEESLLSTTGIRPLSGPFAGELVGQVMDNRIVADMAFQLLPRVDIFGSGGGGYRNGVNVESNSFFVAGGGAGYNVLARSEDEPLSLVRAVYDLNYFGFGNGRFGFGGASLQDRAGRPLPADRLGSDGISTATVGGYFSPDNFLSHVIRGEVRGRLDPSLDYQVSAFVGSQYYTGSPRRQATGFAGTVTYWLTDSHSIPITFIRDNFGPFTQNSLVARLVARF